jgi:hypothetical protein
VRKEGGRKGRNKNWRNKVKQKWRNARIYEEEWSENKYINKVKKDRKGNIKNKQRSKAKVKEKIYRRVLSYGIWRRLVRWNSTDVSEEHVSIFWTLKMEAKCSTETSVVFQRITWSYIPEHRTLHNHRREKFKSDKKQRNHKKNKWRTWKRN